MQVAPPPGAPSRSARPSIAMKLRRLPSIPVLSLSLAALFFGGSCAHVEHAVRGPVEAIVDVPTAADGRSEKLVVESSPNRDCEAGVRALAKSEWEVAITAFERVLREDPADWRALYARGVAQEMLGRYDAALADYRASNENAPSQSLACLTAIERAKSKAGR